MALPINIRDLLNGTTVEWERLECKGGWNPESVVHTLCAFANDLHDWGGGYIVIGVTEEDGRPVLPPRGVPATQVDKIQKELLNLSHRMTPSYFPVVEPTVIDGKHVVLIWAPGGENRPYKAPVSHSRGSANAYYVRIAASTVIAKDRLEQELLQLAAKIPFDDRLNHHGQVEDLSRGLIQGHLQEIKSALADEAPSMDFIRLGRRMRIVGGTDENPRPINVGLLFFSEAPHEFFPTAWIDVVHMPGGPSGRELRDVRFTGPLDRQLKSALEHIGTHFIEERTIKRTGRAEADRFFTYPYEAVEESLANAVYHRGYDVREPIEVRVTPAEMTITSYPGPDPSVRVEALKTEQVVARRYRNRRVGEFLKELRLTEGRGTGIPTILRSMRDNGSPEPVFESDETRSYFTTRLPIHPGAHTGAVGGSGKARDNVGADVGRSVTTTPEISEEVRTLLETPIARTILEVAEQPQSREALQSATGISSPSYLLKRYVRPLMAEGLVVYTVPESPRAPNQRYRTTNLGTELVKSLTVE